MSVETGTCDFCGAPLTGASNLCSRRAECDREQRLALERRLEAYRRTERERLARVARGLEDGTVRVSGGRLERYDARSGEWLDLEGSGAAAFWNTAPDLVRRIARIERAIANAFRGGAEDDVSVDAILDGLAGKGE